MASQDPSNLSVDGDLTARGDDKVTISISTRNDDGSYTEHDIVICESYEIKCSVMTVPAAFTLHIGWADVARDLLAQCRPGSIFQLRIGEVTIQTGIIDAANVPSSDSTVVEVKGRDFIRNLIACHVEDDLEFKEKTYYDITKRVMKLVGLEQHELVAGNGANRRAVTATQVSATKMDDQYKVTETGLPTESGSKIEFRSHKAKIGQGWFGWLQDKYKLSGLFLWCGGDGKLILASPDPTQQPSYLLVRQRGLPRNHVNVEKHSYRNDCTNRHAQYIVHGRYGHGKAGRNRIKGEALDGEMLLAGFTDVITYHDDDVATTEQATNLAKRYMSEERRGGYHLEYTVLGHRTIGLDGSVAVWAADTVVNVQDDELGIFGNHYIESVTYRMGQQKTCTLELIRVDDLMYLLDFNPKPKKDLKALLDQNKEAWHKSHGATGTWEKGAIGTTPGASGAWVEEPDISWKWDADVPKPTPGYPGSNV